MGAPRWRVLPTCLLLLAWGQEYSPGQESAQPTGAWAQPELQDTPQGTYEGPGNEMLKAGFFPGTEQCHCPLPPVPAYAAYGSAVMTWALEPDTTLNSSPGL